MNNQHVKEKKCRQQVSNTAKIKLLNPERSPLTKEKLRELSGLTVSDEEAEAIVFSIHLFAKNLYEYIRQKHSPGVVHIQTGNLNQQSKEAA